MSDEGFNPLRGSGARGSALKKTPKYGQKISMDENDPEVGAALLPAVS